MTLDQAHLNTKIDLEQRYEKQIAGERQQRVDIENQMISLKDEALKRDMLSNELDYRCQNLEEQNINEKNKNMGLQKNLHNITTSYEIKIQDLNNELENYKNSIVFERG